VDSPNESDIFVVATEKTITQAGVNASATHVLPIGTTIISARGTVGKVCIAGVPTAMNQSCYGLRGRLDSKGSYTYFSTRFLASTLQNHSHGSVFATITRSTFEGVSVVVPPRKIVEAFENQAEPFLEQIRNHLLQRQLLVSIRDTLLPRLLSGEMPVL
jgi:type I restriction enzyme S subunit